MALPEGYAVPLKMARAMSEDAYIVMANELKRQKMQQESRPYPFGKKPIEGEA